MQDQAVGGYDPDARNDTRPPSGWPAPKHLFRYKIEFNGIYLIAMVETRLGVGFELEWTIENAILLMQLARP